MLLPKEQHFSEPTKKRQIVLHHTVSNITGGAEAVWHWWNSNPERVGTHYVIDYSGNIYLFLDETFWIHHLGIRDNRNTPLNKASIGIELVCWGGLVKKDNQFYQAGQWTPKGWTAGRVRVEKELVTEYEKEYRSFSAFQSYSKEQLSSLEVLLKDICERHDIPKTFNSDMFELSEKALSGEKGIFSHTSYRGDKSDVHPQKELIEMLQNLDTK